MRRFAALLCLLAAACAGPPPQTPRPPAPAPGAAPPAAPAPPVPAPPAPPPPRTDIQVPSDALYVCLVESPAGPVQSRIEFTPQVLDLCRRHPEMGPCQYERNACRQRGGRVFAAGGTEITRGTEAEYDRKVLRRRFRSN